MLCLLSIWIHFLTPLRNCLKQAFPRILEVCLLLIIDAPENPPLIQVDCVAPSLVRQSFAVKNIDPITWIPFNGDGRAKILKSGLCKSRGNVAHMFISGQITGCADSNWKEKKKDWALFSLLFFLPALSTFKQKNEQLPRTTWYRGRKWKQPHLLVQHHNFECLSWNKDSWWLLLAWMCFLKEGGGGSGRYNKGVCDIATQNILKHCPDVTHPSF